MKLRLDHVFENPGESVSFECPLDLGDACFRQTAASGRVFNKNGLVELHARVNVTYTGACDRCTVQTDLSFLFDFSHTLVTSLNHEENDVLILVSDGVLDLDGLLVSDVLLHLPSKFLCDPDCKGLCPDCGNNLNIQSCQCSKAAIDPRLAGLKDLLK